MKRFLSMLLTLILVLNIFVSTGMLAFATEGSEECTHTDGSDNYDNICDNCAEYIGTDELAHISVSAALITNFFAPYLKIWHLAAVNLPFRIRSSPELTSTLFR